MTCKHIRVVLVINANINIEERLNKKGVYEYDYTTADIEQDTVDVQVAVCKRCNTSFVDEE